MSQPASNIVPLNFLSAAQPDLFNAALSPDDIKLDHRKTADILAFLSKLATQFNYYDTNNEINGNWQSFFETDKHALFALIIDDGQEMVWQRINDLLKGLSYTESITERADFCWNIFEACFNEVFRINEWYLTFTKYYTNQEFQVYLKQSIWQQFSFSLQTLYNLYHKALLDDLINDKSKTDPLFRKLQKLANVWNFQPFPLDADTGPKSIHQDPEAYRQRLASAIKDFYNLHESLRRKAKKAFDKSLTDGDASPHMTLIISFLELYKHQQKSLNKMVERHMKFYYHDVLDFHKQGASPDSVFVMFELGKNVLNYALPKASLLDAGKSAAGSAITFQTNNPLLVTPSQIGTYLSLYSETDTEDSNQRTLKTATIAKYNSPSADKLTGNFVSFPMFGNDGESTTHDSPQNPNVKTDTATIGFAISSPELTLSGGTRKVTILIELEETEADSRKALKEHSLHGKFTNLTGLIDFELTSAKKWFKPSEQSVSFDGSYLTVELLMEQSEEATAPYNAKKHGPGFDTKWPILKATITDPVEIHRAKGLKGIFEKNYKVGYNTLQNLRFKSYTIECVVTELNDINLVVGGKKMPATATAAPFGSIPEVGSRLLISSYEAFVKHTNDLCIRTNWVNLPNDKAFAEYYKAYNMYLVSHLDFSDVFKRDEYKATLQWMDQGTWVGDEKVELFEGSTCDKFETALDTPEEETKKAEELEKPHWIRAILGAIWHGIVWVFSKLAHGFIKTFTHFVEEIEAGKTPR